MQQVPKVQVAETILYYYELMIIVFYPAKNWEERCLQIQDVKDKCSHILEKLDLPDNDARSEAIFLVRQFCSTLAAVPIRLQRNAEKGSNLAYITQLLGLHRLEDLKSCLSDLDENAKVSFITMTQFALENCIERVLDAVPGEKAQGAFDKSSLRLLEVVGIADHKTRHEILMVPAWIRSALLSAGVNDRSSRTVVIDEEAYTFEKGKKLFCASWSHLMHCLSSALDINEEMLCSSVVAAISRIGVDSL